ncbi:probable cytochrome P450 6a23 [Uranotaenia lowii]|uniref:probable cytochrome P450 6a23 n=1 Tax=Uranotaenia lowii TaxID=190385 RepID=UPI0024796313|nr:probable cytochrome P450 6a23 [Uranotaenia lowii]
MLAIGTALLTGLVFLIALFYVWSAVRSRQLYWSCRKIPFVAGSHWLFGNVGRIWRSEHSSVILQRVYDELKERRFPVGGFNFFLTPSILVVDPERIRRILVEDESVYNSPRLYINENSDPLSCTTYNSVGDGWRSSRDILGPIQNDEVLKRMFADIAAAANELNGIIRKEKQKNRKNLDILDLMERYVTQTIGTNIFGIRCRTISNPRTEFHCMSREASRFKLIPFIKQWFAFSFPFISRKFDLKITEKAVEKFFTSICQATVLHRESYQIRRHDLLQHFIQVRQQEKMTLRQITAQCYSFALYGIQPCSATMAFCLYEVANNPVIQKRLREEIFNALKETDGQLTFELISSLTYLDQVLRETLRKYPPVDFIYRRSSQTHDNVPGGTPFIIPIYALHHDSDHFPSPEQFNPDRFSPDRCTKSWPTFSYLPFGAGQRSCVGARFAPMICKIGLVTLIRSFRFSLTDNDKGAGVCLMPNARVLRPAEGTLRLKVDRVRSF